jgi:hypothetical protein
MKTRKENYIYFKLEVEPDWNQSKIGWNIRGFSPPLTMMS